MLYELAWILKARSTLNHRSLGATTTGGGTGCGTAPCTCTKPEMMDGITIGGALEAMAMAAELAPRRGRRRSVGLGGHRGGGGGGGAAAVAGRECGAAAAAPAVAAPAAPARARSATLPGGPASSQPHGSLYATDVFRINCYKVRCANRPPPTSSIQGILVCWSSCDDHGDGCLALLMTAEKRYLEIPTHTHT